MKQLVDPVVKMHTKDVFHCNIKAKNVLIETGINDPRLRVIDFGCGCIAQEEPYSYFSGNKAFSPPEFFTHGRYEAAPTTVWQLGALLYNKLDILQPFITSRFLSESISFIDCKNVLELCLARNPKKRATVEQIQLHPWLQNAAQSTPQTPSETQ